MDDALEHPSTIVKSDPSADGADAGQSSDEDDEKHSATADARSTPSTSKLPSNSPYPHLPVDHSSLRAKYDAKYPAYLNAMQKLVNQKTRIAAALKKGDGSTATNRR